MNHYITTLALVAGLLAISLAPAPAQDPIRLNVYTAIEVEYDTMPGKSYTLQGTTNLSDWTDIGSPTPGTGRLVNRIFSTKGGGELHYNSYRLRVGEGPTNGFAPWLFAGVSLEMDDEPGGDVMNFTTETNGVDVSEGENDSFTYLYSRLGENEAKAELTNGSNRTEMVTFNFTGPGVGTWSRDEFRNGQLKDHDAGSFRIVGIVPVVNGTDSPVVNANLVIAPPLAPPAPPVTLSNMIYYFQASGIPDRYEFLDDHNGREVQGVVQEGLPTNALVYTYTVLSSNTAHLLLSFGYYGMGGDRYDCDLTFTDGPSGHFVRRLYRRGVLKDTDDGAFSPDYPQVSPPPGGTNNPPINTNPPPANPLGLTFIMNTGEQLAFQTASTGLQTDNSAPTDFTYNYAATDANTFTLRVEFKPDKWDEYDLTFTDGAHGSFICRQYDGNDLKDTDADTFYIVPTTP